ncbi:uncharacterized protein LOC130796212 [Actinidia eriantha]|uniref:uncharacterized protein LOC130796212 n=1 Tax=Actinidia eriantha TaxID=165200 RepID=UPI00258F316B|nr:uncharacterized protein LOC130796212 [Actinidia eriantha]XP_057514514.1 uncharacterized protein LOC130796212 [Actinidia eriantha]XP_057514515.1 uncharacterized protein LOC130796212 [Actinidia eriantha]
MDNRINIPPSGNFDVDVLLGSSRKRKSTAMDQPGAISGSIFQYCSPWESNLPKANLLSGAQVQENAIGVCLSQQGSAEQATLRNQFEKDQLQNQNFYPGPWLNGNGIFHGSGTENVTNASSRVPPQPLECKGSLESFNVPAGQSFVLSNCQSQPHNMFGPPEAYTSLPFPKSYEAHTGQGQVASHFQELVSLGMRNHVTEDMLLGMHNTPFKTLSIKFLQESFLKPKGHSDDMAEIPSSQKDTSGVSCDVPTIGAASLGSSLCIEQNRNHSLVQKDVQFSSSSSVGVHLGNISDSEERGHKASVKLMEMTEASGLKNLKHPLPDESSPTNANPANLIENGQKNDQTHGSLISDEKSKTHIGKPTSAVAEKLWNGSLQLSSSVIISAVAFFKSGERLLDTNWCESVEVKGKVRLEAFEKYIQDLPRSRNRGLMVISLCWKEGSSETGLKGMKEVAKGYKKGKRVGFAQLSPGIDLYICPRSDAIITILAKYGFFKGMAAAVEDNQDSMIGCVVWRKNPTSSNSVTNKPKSKSNSSLEKSVNSPSVSPMKQAAEKHLSVTQPAQTSISPASDLASSSIEDTEKNGSNLLLPSSNPNDSTSISVGPEQPKRQLELHEPVMLFAFDTPKKPMPSLDDDDLPEFDFRTACGVSQTKMSKPLVNVQLDKRLPAEGIRNTDRSVLPGMPNAQAMTVFSQRSDLLNLSGLPLTANAGIPPLKICDREPQKPFFPSTKERSSVPNNGTTRSSVLNKGATIPVSASVFAPPKSLFDDDDDDMPEWCPPELQRQSLPETTRASTSFPSKLPNPTFQHLARGPSRPVLRPYSPSPASTGSPLSSQTFPPRLHCPTTKSPLPRLLTRSPNFSSGPNSNSILGPPPNFHVKPPFYRHDK